MPKVSGNETSTKFLTEALPVLTHLQICEAVQGVVKGHPGKEVQTLEINNHLTLRK